MDVFVACRFTSTCHNLELVNLRSAARLVVVSKIIQKPAGMLHAGTIRKLDVFAPFVCGACDFRQLVSQFVDLGSQRAALVRIRLELSLTKRDTTTTGGI